MRVNDNLVKLSALIDEKMRLSPPIDIFGRDNHDSFRTAKAVIKSLVEENNAGDRKLRLLLRTILEVDDATMEIMRAKQILEIV